MKTLYLLRHAKSSWDDAAISDFQRPLNERGLKAAPFMGELMAGRDLAPSLIVSSPAMRAKQTAELVKEAGGFAADIALDQRIYEASPNTLRQIVSEIDDGHVSALLVGHNPGMEGLISYLTGRPDAMPTAALAVIDLDISQWASLNDDCGTLRKVFRPRDEMK